MKIKELQFPKYFLLNEINANTKVVEKILNTNISISSIGDSDSVIIKNNKITISNPSSLARFLTNVLYYGIKPYVVPGFQQDKLALSLMYMCKDYVYDDYAKEHSNKNISTITSFDKIPALSILFHEIIEPIVGKAKVPEVLMIHSNIVDACHVSEDQQDLIKTTGTKRVKIPCDYPILVLNQSVYNHAAKLSHLFAKVLKVCYSDKSEKIIKHILLDGKNGSILNNVISVLKIIEGEPEFIADFIKYLKSSVKLTTVDNKKISENYAFNINKDKYLNSRTKVASPNYTPQVFKQWHQWSMIMGLIEKQLQPMRGSMWPATENIKPFEDVFRSMLTERSKKKNKSQLNMEEMLEVSRELYNHKAIQPGKLYESLLKEDRVWKT